MSEEKDFKNNDGVEEELVVDVDGSELELEDVSGDDKAKIVKLKAKLKSALKEKDEYLSGWQRCRADFVNAKRMSENDRLGMVDSIEESFVRDILPVLDAFDLALASMDQAGVEWRAGFLGIYSKMLEILGQRGLKQIGKVGDKFDVREAESVMAIPVDKEELDDVVAEVFQKGYTLNGRVIRPAKVRVGQYEKLV